jgi:hypothetical protein
MKFYVILLIVLVAAVGLLIYSGSSKRIYRARFSGINADSIRVFEERAAQLTASVDSLKAALTRAGLVAKLPVARRLEATEARLSELRYTLRRWRDARDEEGRGQAYRDCLLLYGKAQSACQALSFDTLPPDSAR